MVKKSTQFIWGIALLRIFAMILITNSHYDRIYSVPSLAFGGLMGNVIFFAVSGYCLANIGDLSFFKWYKKRLMRIYPQTLLMTVFSVCIGYLPFYPGIFKYWIHYFIYPTYYHFIGAIAFCYIVYYFLVKITPYCKDSLYILAGLLVLQLIVYIVFFDKSKYTVDLVEYNQFEFIRFLYIISMFFGLWLRNNRDKIHLSRWFVYGGTFVGAVLYFGSKIYFSKTQTLLKMQIVNQYSLLLLLAFLLIMFLCDDSAAELCEKLPPRVQSVLKYISELTLEVYLVQFIIIRKVVSPMNVPGFVKFILATVLILAGAIVLKKLTEFLLNNTKKIIYHIKTKRES